MGNIQDGKIDYGNLKYLPLGMPKLDELTLQHNDVIFNRTNSAELVGKTAVYKEHHPKSTFASYLIRVKLLNLYHPDLLAFCINSYHGRRYIASVVSQQVGQANVNGTKLANMPIPYPPLEEQQRIVEMVERRLSVADEIEKELDESLVRAERLRGSVLKSAFEGRLV
jgi:type I restriction enzyme S subunit